MSEDSKQTTNSNEDSFTNLLKFRGAPPSAVRNFFFFNCNGFGCYSDCFSSFKILSIFMNILMSLSLKAY